MSIRVLATGPLTTVQDAGRTGFAAKGFRCCGAADGYALRLANLLAGNENCRLAVLEMTLRGGTFQFEQDTLFALAGAEMPAVLNDAPAPSFAPLFAPAGSVLTVGTAKTGLRGYLAVYGGIDTPPVLGSRSTDLKCRMGGLEGRALRAGDVLPVEADGSAARQRWNTLPQKSPLKEKSVCSPALPRRFLGQQAYPLFRAVPGPQADAFTAQGQADFVRSVYTLTPDCDRMACKLLGTPLEAVNGVDIVSDGIVAGSVQVSANGQPIVMLADHQTTGGYAKIATVIGADLPALAQLRPGEALTFTYVTASRAVVAARQQAARLEQIRKRMEG